MRYGTTAATIEAINQAKNSRGTSLGCPQVALTYTPVNTSEPPLSEILAKWNEAYIPAINSYVANLPKNRSLRK